MKFIKKLFVCLTICLSIVIYTACSNNNANAQFEKSTLIVEQAYSLIKNDNNGLSLLFVPSLRSNKAFISDIEILFSEFDDMSISFDKAYIETADESGEKKYDNGILIYHSGCGIIEGISDNENNSYTVIIYYVAIDKDSPQNEGIYGLQLLKNDSIVVNDIVGDEEIMYIGEDSERKYIFTNNAP